MNEKIKNHLINYCKEKGWSHDTDEDLIETLLEGKVVHEEDTNQRRWQIDTWRVVEIDGMFIGYPYFNVTGDTEIDFDFDLEDVYECKQVEKKIIAYEPIDKEE